MQKTNIEWTDHTWNPVTGCTKVSAGCKNCYAETISKRRFGEWKERPFSEIKLKPHKLGEPFKIKEPSKFFVNSMSDLFHEDIPWEFIDKVFAVIALNPQHTFQILTKRPDTMFHFFQSRMIVKPGHELEELQDIDLLWPLPNVWLGVTVENQKTANERIPILLQCPARVHFLSCEPLLEEVDIFINRIENYYDHGGDLPDEDHREGYFHSVDCPGNCDYGCGGFPIKGKIDWVIAGGESGPNHRPVDVDWIRSLRDQCAEFNVAFFFKQWGGVRPKEGGNILDGSTYLEFPQAKGENNGDKHQS
ncbi:phage Gp37/Gp68 family protein [Leptospira langatensis]|uniref:Phage Gp37/Gp68 family protein n=1 Tax=Leptospira langatensis TaxID=2484983 RepID=A0A5R2ATN1_9LEPT|nr:phage Gp37/Gp68 family protein [Leptospira langatensis]TGJ99819.1 phage Gp37/Gp68 family protein [Leptospira langatensis]